MKSWRGNTAKDYLTFSKKDRRGLFLFLFMIIGLLVMAKYYTGDNTKAVSKESFSNELAKLNITIDSSKKYGGYKTYRDDDANEYDYRQPKQYAYKRYNDEAAIKGELFEFDPNTLDADGWKRLGVRDKTISTIDKFVGKGYRFRQPDDIRKIYGLRPEEADRLVPFVKIAEPATAGTASNIPTATTATAVYTAKPYAKTKIIVDVTTADTTAFIALPGIGSKLAARIINFREKLGGFVSIDQVGETYGVPDSTFQLIKPQLQMSSSAVKKININTADVNELKAHPYIRWHVGNAIVNYKKQHGDYKSLDDLKKISIISDDIFSKMAPYLTL